MSARIAAPVPASNTTAIVTCAATSTAEPTRLPLERDPTVDATRIASLRARETAIAGQSPETSATIPDNDAAKRIAVVPTTIRPARCEMTPGTDVSTSGSTYCATTTAST